MASISYVLLEPEELVFHNVRLSQVYTQQLRITNTLRGPLELTIKPGSVERYTVTPSSLRLRGEESALVEVRLRVLRFAQKQKAIEQGHRDVFHIKVCPQQQHIPTLNDSAEIARLRILTLLPRRAQQSRPNAP